MLEKLNKINWDQYKWGVNPPDIPKSLQDLASDDWLTRENANDILAQWFDIAFKFGSDLLIIIIPFLVELFNSPDTPDKILITDLLIHLISFSERDLREEPYKTLAKQIKQTLCEVSEMYETSFQTSTQVALREI